MGPQLDPGSLGVYHLVRPCARVYASEIRFLARPFGGHTSQIHQQQISLRKAVLLAMGGACTRQARAEQPEQPEQQPAEVPKADPEELAKLSLSDLKEAFDALVCKDGQSYAPGKIMKVMYTYHINELKM